MQRLVEKIAKDVTDSEHNHIIINDERERLFPGSTKSLVAHNLPFGTYSELIEKDVIRDSVKFYSETTHSLNSSITSCVELTLKKQDLKYILDKDVFSQRLGRIFQFIKSGKVPYVISGRVINVSAQKTIVLKNNPKVKAYLRIIPETHINIKYPLSRFTHNRFNNKVSLKHNLEFVVEKSGTLSEIERDLSIEGSNIIINKLTNSFILAGFVKMIPYCSHLSVRSIFQNCMCDHGIQDFSIDPTLLSDVEIENLIDAYEYVEQIENDEVLERSFDRFILGVKQEYQNPNKINSPNWNKIVDYIIALETVLLTVDGNQHQSELTYKFKLNGSSLLKKIMGTERETIFTVLGKLYAIRSAIVHGDSQHKILKYVNDFISLLDIDDEQHKHPIGRLILTSQQLEEWLLTILSYLSEQKDDNKPYKISGGWEKLLWNDK